MNFQELFQNFDIDPISLIESIVEADIPSVILFKDLQSRILYVNKRFFYKHREFQKDPSSVYGKTDFDLFPNSKEHAKQAYEDEQYVISSGQAINIVEIEGRDETGKPKIAHTKKYPVYNSQHQVIGTFIITEDVTTDINVIEENKQKAALLAKLNQELTTENTMDSLSGLYNRRFIRAELDSLMKQYQQKQESFSLIMMDLDNFKRINDEFGHTVGDEVITYVGSVLTNIKRLKHTRIEPCRYGGDEFLIIIPTSKLDYAIEVANDLKDAFDNQLLSSGAFHESIQLSMGISCVKDQENVHDLLVHTDDYLYKAKRRGKNQIYYEEE